MEQQIFLQGGRSNEGEGKVVAGDERLRGPETSSREEVAATAASMVRAGTGKGMYRSRRRRASWGLVFVPGQNVFLFFFWFWKFPGQNVLLVWLFGVTWAQSDAAGLTASRSSAVSSARLLLSGGPT